jgi:hypothetical protein
VHLIYLSLRIHDQRVARLLMPKRSAGRRMLLVSRRFATGGKQTAEPDYSKMNMFELVGHAVAETRRTFAS